MSQEELFNKNSENDSEFGSEFEGDSESEYEDIGSDTEYEDSESSSEYEESNPKRRKNDAGTAVEEVLETDETGHIKWHPGQLLGSFKIESVLGEGAYGRVLRAQNLKTGRLTALKVIQNEQAERNAAKVEIAALKMLACKDPRDKRFCIKMLSSFIFAGHICIALPLLAATVFDFLRDNDFQPFSVDEVRHISYQLLSAVTFLHQNGMIHTDLKPENILFVNSSFTTVFNESGTTALRRLHSTEIRLSDFGNVTRDNEYHQSIITTCYYRAPEVTLLLDWTNSCDIWSIGCIMFELYIGHLLFPTNQDLERLAMIEKILGEFPAQIVDASTTPHFQNGKLDWDWNQEGKNNSLEHCRPLSDFQKADNMDDNQLFQLIHLMLRIEPNHRISAKAALGQPFFRKLPPKLRIPNEKLL